MKCYFIAIDGDAVGDYLEFLIVTNQIQELSAFSLRYKSAMSWLESQLVELFNATMIFSGGDNLLAFIPNECNQEQIESVRRGFAQLTAKSLSVGLGMSPRQALFALQFAKSSGKNSIRRFDELPEDQIDNDNCSK